MITILVMHERNRNFNSNHRNTLTDFHFYLNAISLQMYIAWEDFSIISYWAQSSVYCIIKQARKMFLFATDLFPLQIGLLRFHVEFWHESCKNILRPRKRLAHSTRMKPFHGSFYIHFSCDDYYLPSFFLHSFRSPSKCVYRLLAHFVYVRPINLPISLIWPGFFCSTLRGFFFLSFSSVIRFYGLCSTLKFIHWKFIQMLFGIRECSRFSLGRVCMFVRLLETNIKYGNKWRNAPK